MNDLILILWIIGWPLGGSVESYIVARRKEITGEPQYTTEQKYTINVLSFIVWIVVSFVIML